MREQAIQAYRILNNMVGDLVVATRWNQSFDLQPNLSSENLLLSNRMTLSILFITLSKWIEFYDRYQKIIPKDIRGICLELRKNIENRGIRKFRNEVVGHIWSKKLNRPLLAEEIQEILLTILGNDKEAFLSWVNDSSNNIFPNTVISIIEETRDRIGKEFELTKNEIF